MLKSYHLTLVLWLITITTHSQSNTFPSSGNVGIGIVSPDSKLHIYSAGGQNFGLLTESTSANSYAGSDWKNSSGDIAQMALTGSSFLSGMFLSRQAVINSSAPNGLSFVAYNATGSITFGTGGFLAANERMIINSAGSVGIGTNAPSGKLHIAGVGSSLNVGSGSPVSGDLIVQSNTGSRSTTSGAQIEFVIPANSDGGNLWGQGRIITVAGNTNSGDASGKMILGTRRYFHKPGTSGVEWFYGDDLTIDPSGNIGIGTTTPDAKLAVKGTVHAEEVKVDLNVPGPDYVFEENYNLPSLKEIENYIKQNKHLPEVPSANEMEKNGINLSEMNMLLLKKVEELTLHLIDSNKKIENQQLQIERLTKKIDERN